MSFLRKDVNKLLIKIKKGDHESKNVLFKMTYNHLKFVALYYVYNKNDTEDVASEAFLRVFEYIDTFSPDKDGYNWLCKVVQNVAYDWNKKYMEFEPLEEETLHIHTIDFGEVIATKDEVKRWLEPYGEIDKKIIHLKYWNDMTYDAIAKKLGMKRSTVYKREQKMLGEILKIEKKRQKKVNKS